MRVLDLSFPIVDHFRWKRSLERTQAFERGDLFQTTALSLSCHAFTHTDAPVHFRQGGQDIAEVPLSTWAGEAGVIDVSDVGADAAVSADVLRARAPRLDPDGIALVKTCWDAAVAVDSIDYWRRSPYVTRDGAEWLRDQGLRCVGFDFPQDWGIRLLVEGQTPQAADFPTHEVLLAQGVGMVEYLAGLDQTESERLFFVAAPLRLRDGDGSPVRALGLDPPPGDTG